MSDLAKILVCDDSVLARSQMRNLIEQWGNVEIFEAKTGAEAIEKYKSEKPDLVFLDIVMPEVNGIEAVKAIIEYDKDAKLVMASSIGNSKYLKAALEAGAIDFIQKPVDADRVLDVVNKIVGGN